MFLLFISNSTETECFCFSFQIVDPSCMRARPPMQLAETDQNIVAVILYNSSILTLYIDKSYEILEQENLKVMKYLCPRDAIFTCFFFIFFIYLELAEHDVGSSFVCQVRVRPLQWRHSVIKTFCCRQKPHIHVCKSLITRLKKVTSCG